MRSVLFLVFPAVSALASAEAPDLAAVAGDSGPSRPWVAIVRWPQPIGFAAARSLAVTLGGTLASIPDADTNTTLTCLRNADELGLGPCDGPWIGLERPAAIPPGAAWRWNGLATPDFTHWSEGSPSTSVRIAAAAALRSDGTWIDSIPSTDAGTEVRAAAILWPPSSDADQDGVPDALAASGIPTIVVAPSRCGRNRADLDGNGRVDSADLSIVLAGWGTAQEIPDIDDDGTVGPLDLGAVLAAWTVE